MSHEEKSLFRLARFCALLALLFGLTSLLSISLNPVFPGEMGLLAQTRILTLHPWRWSLMFILAAAGAMVQGPVVLGLAALLKRKSQLYSQLALVHGLMGLAFCVVSDFMQATVVRKAGLEMMQPEIPERLRAGLLSLSGQWNALYPFSTAYALSLLGQSFSAVMFLCVGFAWFREKVLKKIVAVISFFAALTQAVALLLYLLDLDSLFPAGLFALFSLLIFALLIFVFKQAERETA